MLCLWICLNFHVFICLRRIIKILLLSLAPHWSYISISLSLKHQNDCLPCSNQISAETVLHPLAQIWFSHCFQQNPKNPNQIKPLHLIPSLRSVENLVISSLIDYLLPRLTRREPSPVLVGLATRLSVVWCGPRTLSFQPETNLGSNTFKVLSSVSLPLQN